MFVYRLNKKVTIWSHLPSLLFSHSKKIFLLPRRKRVTKNCKRKQHNSFQKFTEDFFAFSVSISVTTCSYVGGGHPDWWDGHDPAWPYFPGEDRECPCRRHGGGCVNQCNYKEIRMLPDHHPAPDNTTFVPPWYANSAHSRWVPAQGWEREDEGHLRNLSSLALPDLFIFLLWTLPCCPADWEVGFPRYGWMAGSVQGLQVETHRFCGNISSIASTDRIIEVRREQRFLFIQLVYNLKYFRWKRLFF